MLKDHIEKSGKSRKEWAKDLGISRGYLSLLEDGLKTPSLAVAARIERATGGAVPAVSWVEKATREGAA